MIEKFFRNNCYLASKSLSFSAYSLWRLIRLKTLCSWNSPWNIYNYKLASFYIKTFDSCKGEQSASDIFSFGRDLFCLVQADLRILTIMARSLILVSVCSTLLWILNILLWYDIVIIWLSRPMLHSYVTQRLADFHLSQLQVFLYNFLPLSSDLLILNGRDTILDSHNEFFFLWAVCHIKWLLYHIITKGILNKIR